VALAVILLLFAGAAGVLAGLAFFLFRALKG
jgi:hypothetical protein